MVKSVNLAMMVVLLGVVAGVQANTTITAVPWDYDMWDLSHDNLYVWRINATIPDGETFDLAQLAIRGIYNRFAWEKNVLFVQLLGPEEIEDIYFGWDNIYIGSDNQWLHENSIESEFGGTELLQWIDYDGPETKDNILYSFSDEELGLLNSYIQDDGELSFAIGFDPDCWFYWDMYSTPNCGIKFTGQTSATVIPAPGSVLLGSIGVAFVGWLRRRKTI